MIKERKLEKSIKSFISLVNIDRANSKGDIYTKDNCGVYCKKGMIQGYLFKDLIENKDFAIQEYN